jgi:Fe-S oxidoreductase/nitrate reductase gamma subunit
VNIGQGVLGFDEIGGRTKDLLVKGFGQKLVLRRPSGFGHLIIFYGFFVLTYGTLESLIAGVWHGFNLDFLGPFHWLMNTSQDILAAGVILALLVALYRRLIIRPRRLEGELSHTLDALIIIGLILTLIICFYGMRVIEPRIGFTPVADGMRRLFLPAGAGLDTHYAAWKGFEWMHHLVVLGFLAYIPFSKHLHIVTALPNLFFRKPFVRGRIDRLDLEDENAETFGVVKITDYSKKELLDVMACTECGRCQEACPAYATGKPLNPKQVVLDLKDYLFDEGPAFLKDPNAEPRKALYGDTISEDVLWSCTTCRACEEACPVEIRPMTKLIAIRQSRVLMEGDFPEEAQNALRNIENQMNPWGLPQEKRGAWAEDLGVKTLAEDADVEYLFFVGCAGSYDQRYMEVTKSFAKILQHAGVKFGILGAEEVCTGDSAKRIGNDYLAQSLAEQNVETMKGYGVTKIVTACPHCFNSIKNEFPQYGADFEVIHHSELINDLLRAGKLKLSPAAQGEITYHDSCYLSRYNEIIESPRNVIAAAAAPVKEMDRVGMDSFCCGAGGGRMWMEERIGTNVNVDRAKEALATGAATVATACPFCMTMMTDGVKQQGREAEVKVRDIAEIVADGLE